MMRRKTAKKYYVIFIMLICALIGVLYNTSRIKLETILINSTCKLPCWNGIVPGITTKEEFVNIINQLPFVYEKPIVIYNNPPEWKYPEAASFTMKFVLWDSLQSNRGYALFSGNTLVGLSLAGNIGLRLEEMISKFGEPEFVYTTLTQPGDPYVHFLYPSIGLVMEYITTHSQWDISPNHKISRVVLVDPRLYKDFLESDELVSNTDQLVLYPWKGFGSIKELYYPITLMK